MTPNDAVAFMILSIPILLVFLAWNAWTIYKANRSIENVGDQLQDIYYDRISRVCDCKPSKGIIKCS